MKKESNTILYVVLAVVGLGVGVLMGLRPWEKTGNGDDEINYEVPMEVCHIAFNDSVSMYDAKAYLTMEVDFPLPSDTSPVARGVRAWLYEDIPYLTGAMEDPEAVSLSLDLPSTINDSDYVEAYVRYGLDTQRKMLEEEAGDGWAVDLEHRCTVEKLCDEPYYVTYLVHRYRYEGGAHGGQVVYGKTFCKKTGEDLGWKLVEGRDHDSLLLAIKEGLKTYFSEDSETPVKTDEELRDCLLLWDESAANDTLVGLPGTEPWLTPDGIVFLYQQYEIAPYAAGHPTAVIK